MSYGSGNSDAYGYDQVDGGERNQKTSSTAPDPDSYEPVVDNYSDSHAVASNRTTNYITWGIGGLCLIFAAISVIFCVVYGIKDKREQHFLLAAVIIIECVLLVILWRWSLAPDVEPKFNWIVYGMVVLLVVTCIAAQVYVWVGCPTKHCHCSSSGDNTPPVSTPISTPVGFPCTSGYIYWPTSPGNSCVKPCDAGQALNMTSGACSACAGGNGTDPNNITALFKKFKTPIKAVQQKQRSEQRADQDSALLLQNILPMLSDLSFIQKVQDQKLFALTQQERDNIPFIVTLLNQFSNSLQSIAHNDQPPQPPQPIKVKLV